MATLRERVERQRSVTSSTNNGSESNSLEGLNLERGDSHPKNKTIERLDSQVSTLHQDVAALSVEVSHIVANLLKNFNKNLFNKNWSRGEDSLVQK